MSLLSFVMTFDMTVWKSDTPYEGDRQVAKEGGHYGRAAGVARMRKRPRHWSNTQWDRACRDAKRRTRIYQAKPGKAVVYVMQDAEGRCKVGLSDAALPARLCAVQFLVGKARRPVRLIHAVAMCPSIAGKVERATHRRLCYAALGGEWFKETPKECLWAIGVEADRLSGGAT